MKINFWAISLLVYIFLCCSHSQSIQTETLVNTQGSLKIQDIKMIPHFYPKDNYDNYSIISGVFVTNANWNKQDIVLETVHENWQKTHRISKSIELLPSSKKKFSIFVKQTSSWSTPILYTKIAGKIAFQTTINPNYNTYYSKLDIIYVSPKDYANVSYLKPIIEKSVGEVEIMSITEKDLPESWLGYSRADLVILNSDRPFLNISSDSKKIQALIQWVRAGGNILISCGSELWLEKNSFISELLGTEQIKPQMISNKVHPELFSVDFHKMFPSTRQYSLPHPRQQQSTFTNLLWHLKIGHGRITYLGADIKDYIEQKSNLQNPLFWKKYVYSKLSRSLLHKNADIFRQTRDEFTKERTPVSSLIVVIMLLYVLLVGPVNFFVLKRKKKTLFLVFSIPVIALTFSFVVLFYGFFSKGIDNIGKKISMTYYLGNKLHYTKEYLGISSGSKSLYSIKGEGNFTISTASEVENARYTQIDNSIALVDYPINLWEMKFFFINTITKKEEIKCFHQTSQELSLKIPKNWKLAHAFYVYNSEISIVPLEKIKEDSFKINKIKTNILRSRSLDRYLQSYKYPSHTSRMLSKEIKLYKNNYPHNFTVLIIKKNISSTVTTPSININEELNVVFIPVTEKGENND